MKLTKTSWILSFALCAALSGCGGGEKKPEGEGTSEVSAADAKKKEAEKNAEAAAAAYDDGAKAETAGDYVRARDAYLKTKSYVPDYKDVDARLRNLEDVIVAQQKLSGAASDADRAEAEVGFADALRRRNDLDKAANELQKALEINPTLAVAHVELAKVKFEEGDLKSSLERAQKASEADAQSAEANYQLAFLHRTAQVDGADPTKAVEHAKKAVELSKGSDWKMLELLAAIYHDQGQMEQAIAALKDACKASNGNPRLMKKLEAWAPGTKVDLPTDKAGGTDKPADAPKADEPKADEPKADAPKADAPKADEPKADAPKADEPKADAPKADEPKADAPKADEPKADAPKADEPKADAPKADAPKADEPKADAPKADEPKGDAPAGDMPK